MVTTVAGGVTSGRSDGIGSAAGLSSPNGVAVDRQGVLYVVDYGNNLIRKIIAVGNNQVQSECCGRIEHQSPHYNS